MIDYRAVVRTEIDRFARAARTDPAAQVVHCPEWSVADLTWHMCRTLRFWRAIRDKASTVLAGNGKCEITDGPADVVVRADAQNVLLLLWMRRDTSDVAHEGDIEVLDRFLARTDLT